MTQEIYDEFDGNAHRMAAEIARLRTPITQEQLVARAHALGLHAADVYFHEECPICLKTAVDDFIGECSDILCSLEKDRAIPDFMSWFEPLATNAMVLHDEPVYLLANFLGIYKQGCELEADPEFQVVEAVAKPIRQRRLMRAAT